MTRRRPTDECGVTTPALEGGCTRRAIMDDNVDERMRRPILLPSDRELSNNY